MVRVCHKSHDSRSKTSFRTPKGWATPLSAEEMLDRQYQRVDIPVRAKTAHNGLLRKRLEEDLCWILPDVPLDDPIDPRDWTELNWKIRCNWGERKTLNKNRNENRTNIAEEEEAEEAEQTWLVDWFLILNTQSTANVIPRRKRRERKKLKNGEGK